MRVVSVVGARPQFIKAAPVEKELRKAGYEVTLVHTGQHYDYGMSQVFFEEMGISNPDANLVFPVHQELITKNGIWNLENMIFDDLTREGAWEFLFVFTPIRFQGATGSPGRPIAIR